MPHLHLSVQHGDDLILKRMKRRHLRRDILRFCDEVRRRRADTVFGADMICGFPTETGAAHQASLDLIDEAGITYLHVFGYSPREGTPAASMPQLEQPVIKARVADMRQLGADRLAQHLASRQHSVEMMLVESDNKGHLSSFELAELDTGRYAAGELVAVEIETAREDRLVVRPLRPNSQTDSSVRPLAG
jgi:threonylcarbamoyladenosine tRNA methylthiotransferase MtaB